LILSSPNREIIWETSPFSKAGASVSFFLPVERQLLLAEMVVVVVKGLLNRQAYFLDLGSSLFDL